MPLHTQDPPRHGRKARAKRREQGLRSGALLARMLAQNPKSEDTERFHSREHVSDTVPESSQVRRAKPCDREGALMMPSASYCFRCELSMRNGLMNEYNYQAKRVANPKPQEKMISVYSVLGNVRTTGGVASGCEADDWRTDD